MDAITVNDLLDAIRQHGKAHAKRPVGDGWYTIDELAAKEGVTRVTMRHRLLVAQENGVQMETATGSIPDAEGKAKRATYWRLKP